MTTRVIVATMALLAAVLGVSWYLAHRPQPVSAEQAVAHERTRVDSVAAAQAETTFVHDTVTVTIARTAYRTLRDSLRLTDTVEVLRVLARADTALLVDSVAIVDAGRAIEAQRAVAGSLREELRLALIPKAGPRFSTVLTGLYDPVNHAPLASAAVGVRVIGNWSLVAVAFERLSDPAIPKMYVGFSVRL